MSNSTKPMRAVRGISQCLCIVLSLLTCGVLSAQNQAHRVRNIVLVHGAWADGSGWKGVYDVLVRDGHNVSMVQEPETSFKKMWLPRSASSLGKMDHAFLWLTVMAAPQSPKRERMHRLRDWYTSRPTCQMLERMKLMSENDFQAISASLLR